MKPQDWCLPKLLFLTGTGWRGDLRPNRLGWEGLRERKGWQFPTPVAVLGSSGEPTTGADRTS